MLKLIFTLDYEIHGNGQGCPYRLMVEPTERMLREFERYGAKLTIMADIAEILRFKEYAAERGRDDFHYHAIADQLREAVRRGHDVQLHIHSSYFNARCEGGEWRQDWTEYNFAGLSLSRMREMVKMGKEFLESLLRPVNPAYRCHVFRAANWSVSPSTNVVQALVENGIDIETSVFKYGRRAGLVTFDYSNAWSNLVPWRADQNDLCSRNEQGRLFEFPIYCERRWVGAFLTLQRIHRVVQGRLHKVQRDQDSPPSQNIRNSGSESKYKKILGKLQAQAWKADFNQCSGRQLIGALERASRKFDLSKQELPFVLIGHSKLFTRLNQWSLRSFLAYAQNAPERFGFGRFGDFALEKLENFHPARQTTLESPGSRAGEKPAALAQPAARGL